MFDWLFRPSCPCDCAAKDWVERRLQWLADEFKDSAFTGRRIVLPNQEFFPDRLGHDEQTAQDLLVRVCGYMDADPDYIELRFKNETERVWLVNEAGHYIAGSAGIYEESEDKFVITLDKSELHDPMSLVGTLAHELAHVRLLGERRINPNAFDHELVTDLTVVHFGLGIFLANVPRNWDSDYTRWPKTKLRKPEYMTPPMFGWALAHLAWFRGEERPAWGNYLNSSARANLKQGLRYLWATNDSWYRPQRLRQSGLGSST